MSALWLILLFNGCKRCTDTPCIHPVFMVRLGVRGHRGRRSRGVPAVLICLDPDRKYKCDGVCHLLHPPPSFLPSCSPINTGPARSPNPKSNTNRSNTSVCPCCVRCCRGYPLRGLIQCLGDGDGDGRNQRRERKTGGRGVPGWLCCVCPLTPDVTSFRFTSTAKLE